MESQETILAFFFPQKMSGKALGKPAPWLLFLRELADLFIYPPLSGENI